MADTKVRVPYQKAGQLGENLKRRLRLQSRSFKIYDSEAPVSTVSDVNSNLDDLRSTTYSNLEDVNLSTYIKLADVKADDLSRLRSYQETGLTDDTIISLENKLFGGREIVKGDLIKTPLGDAARVITFDTVYGQIYIFADHALTGGNEAWVKLIECSPLDSDQELYYETKLQSVYGENFGC